jgi:hypothetical protein
LSKVNTDGVNAFVNKQEFIKNKHFQKIKCQTSSQLSYGKDFFHCFKDQVTHEKTDSNQGFLQRETNGFPKDGALVGLLIHIKYSKVR